MKEYIDLNEEEKYQIEKIATQFLVKHIDHINSIVDRREPAIPPSGSDMFHPELWKGIHWRWFLNKNT